MHTILPCFHIDVSKVVFMLVLYLQDCERIPCPVQSRILPTISPADQVQKNAQWRYGSWTPCSASCGRGNRARYVSCRDALGGVAEESFCTYLPRPSEVSSCFTPCGEWQSGDWSPCPVTCGKGKIMRQVVCTSYHGRIDDDNCDPENKPIIEQDCNIAPCQIHNHFPGNHNHPMLFPQPESPQKSRENDVHNSINQKNKPARGNQWRTGPWGASVPALAQVVLSAGLLYAKIVKEGLVIFVMRQPSLQNQDIVILDPVLVGTMEAGENAPRHVEVE